MKRKYFFIHNAKCAGNSLWPMLQTMTNNNCYRNISKDLEQPFQSVDNLKYAHLPVINCGDDIFNNYITITNIRHPISRFFSIYNYLLERCVNDRSKADVRNFSIDYFLTYNDVYQYKYYGDTVDKAISVINNIDYIIDVDTIVEDLNFLIEVEGFNREEILVKNATEYWVKYFSFSDVIKITKSLNDDIIFYNSAVSVKNRKINNYENKKAHNRNVSV